MSQIKASEVKPGMEIEIVTTRKMKVNRVFTWNDSHWELRGDSGHVARVDADAKITVLAEPQPEEPTAGGSRVVVDGRRFLRAENDALPWVELDAWGWHTWDYLCSLTPVRVIDADPSWTVPADAPEVPERIEEWPEDDEFLRAYEWRDHDGRPWIYSRTHGRWYNFSRTAISKLVTDEPKFGPWTRVTDA